MSFSSAARRLSVGTTAAALLVTVQTGSAQAASYPHVSLARAKAALALAAQLPGGVTQVGTIATTTKAYAVPCLTAPRRVSLPGGFAAGAIFARPVASDSSPDNLIFHLTAVVYATPAAAAAGAARLTAAERSCPTTHTFTDRTGSETVTRTLSAKYAVGSWHGFRTIDHLTESTPTHQVQVGALRDYVSVLVRGNVIASIEEVAPTAASAAQQEARRRAATTVVLARFAAIR